MYGFINAKPIWLRDRETEMNLNVGFYTVIGNEGETQLSIACSTFYRLFVNGSFVAYGPARAGHGFYRVDRHDLASYLNEGQNTIAIEVYGVNVNGYAHIDQPSFLQAELLRSKKVIAATGYDFGAVELCDRVQMVQRLSYQRGFSEQYKKTPQSDDWRINPPQPADTSMLAVTESKTTIKRGTPYPEYEVLRPSKMLGSRTVKVGQQRNDYDCGWWSLDIRDEFKGYKAVEQEFILSDFVQKLEYGSLENAADDGIILPNNSKTYEFSKNTTGFIGLDVSCDAPADLYVIFDEVLIDGDVQCLRSQTLKALRFKLLEPGDYHLLSAEPYIFKYIKIVVLGNRCSVSNLRVVEYKHPPVKNSLALPNERLKTIYDAAVETFRQNAIDIYMDCPGRERAGWLCDSFYTSRVERCLTGTSAVEHDFLENFALPDKFDFIPEKMIPMAYPADHNDHNYIPTWSMWFVLELEEYYARTGDMLLVKKLKERVYNLVSFFKDYENADGLLEKLDSWVFIEWSKANELTQDVNYPSNMIYAGMLEAIGRLYDDANLIEKSGEIKQTVACLSFNGEFFVDNAIIENGRPVNTGICTEVCQYYAFFFGVATRETHAGLWECLLNEFGPKRQENNKYPEIDYANAIVGNSMRLDLLLEYGYTDKLLEEIDLFFYKMASLTGTMWENEHANGDASYCHGFASNVAYWLHGVLEK